MADVHLCEVPGEILWKFLGGGVLPGLKTLPCAIDSGTYPYGVKVGGIPRALKCLRLIMNYQEIFNFASNALFCDSNSPKQAHQKLYTRRTRDCNEP